MAGGPTFGVGFDERGDSAACCLDRGCARLADVFDDGEALFDAVVSYGLEGIVAKRRNGLYRSDYRGWTKVKNPGHWRRESEIEAMRRRRDVERLNPARV